MWPHSFTFAVPWRNAGSETVLFLMLKELVAAGHDVRCYVTDCPGKPETRFEGVHLIPVRNVMIGVRHLQRWKPDVVISHHQNAALSMSYPKGWGGRTVFLTHNQMDLNSLPMSKGPDLIVHNSQWVHDSLTRFPSDARQIVVHPPLDCTRHRVDSTGDAVTLININEHKGGKILARLAARMPDVEFVAVMGGHGVQVRPPRLPNLTVVAHKPDLKPVWEQTRLLLMPSIYESYGLVGIEAGCSGIPTLANPTPGLRESLGPAAPFVTWAHDNLPITRDDYWSQPEWKTEWARPSETHLQAWETRIRSLLSNQAAYTQASTLARTNSDRLCAETVKDLNYFRTEIEALATPNPTDVVPNPIRVV